MYNTKSIVKEFNKIHSKKYDYSLVKYTGMANKVDIICKEHGVFRQTPDKHKGGSGCRICANKEKRKTTLKYTDELKNKKIEVLPQEEYKGRFTKIKHKCTCGNVWEVLPQSILSGGKCPECSIFSKRLNYKSYCEKLNTKDIEVTPIDKDIKLKVKSLHKCHCGSDFMISPQMVLRGTDCGCSRKERQNLIYLDKLAKNNIKVIPLERYEGYKVKIKHKCTCGNVWLAKPESILIGGKCGCTKQQFHGASTYKDRKTILYYITIGGVYKIGITLKDSVIKRYKYNMNPNKLPINIIYQKTFMNGEDAYVLENKIKRDFKKFKYSGENFIINKNKKSGESECFDIDISEYIKDIFI